MRIILAGLFLFIASMVYGQASQEGKLAGKGQQTAAKDQRGTEKSPLVIKTLPAPKSQEESLREEEERKQRAEIERKTLDLAESQFYANIAITLIGLFAAGFSGWAARAASKSAAANAAVVTEMKVTAERQLRAYLWTRPHPDHKISRWEEVASPGIRFKLINNGQTPAYKVRNTFACGVFPDPLEKPLPDIKPVRGSKFVLNPGSDSEGLISKDISEKDREKMQAGTHALYVWGEVTYVDAFNVDRYSRFRMFSTGEGLLWCDDGNDAN